MISVVIPAYCEEASVGAVVDELRRTLAHLQDVEILVVDDGSTDATRAEAEKAGARVLSHPVNIGYGNALKTGIRAARHPVIAITDADGTYPLREIPRLLAELDKGFDMVVGARQGAHYRESTLKQPARVAFNWLARFVAGEPIPDVNSGLRVFRRDRVLPFLDDLSGAFSFTTSLTLLCFLQNYFVRHVPIEYYERAGRSKVRLGRDTLRAAQILVQTILVYNPVKLFLLGAMLFAAVGVAGVGIYALVWPRWELFALSAASLVLAPVALMFGFVAYASNTRLRHVRNLRDPGPRD